MHLCTKCGEESGEYKKCVACRSKHAEYMRKRNKQRLDNGLCVSCGKEKFNSSSLCDICFHKKAKADKDYISRKKINKECVRCGETHLDNMSLCVRCLQQQRIDRLEKKLNGKCKNCCNSVVSDVYCSDCLLKQKERRERCKHNGICVQCHKNKVDDNFRICIQCKEQSRKHYRELQFNVFLHYGGFECICCGETIVNFLQLDHINNNGHEHRRWGRRKLFKWIINNDYPPCFQVLCANCNRGKARNGGVCPHHQIMNIARSASSKYHQNVRRQVIEHYGGHCVCCGEKEFLFLELDHLIERGCDVEKKSTNTIESYSLIG